MTNALKKIAISGTTGQLGQELKLLAADTEGFEYVFLQRPEFDLENTDSLAEKIKAVAPDYFINCAAYTAVDKAEAEHDLAFRINAEAPRIIAAVCKEINCRFIHISTDYVFDGSSEIPYRETDLTVPVTVYGSSKEKGEKAVLAVNDDSIIIRTSWVYSGFGKNFLLTMLRLMQEKQQINVVADQIGTPTNAADLAAAIFHIAKFKDWKPGIYHFSNEGAASWYEFATEIAALSESDCMVKPISTDAYPTPARRPAYSVLDKKKIREAFELHILPWKESLALCIAKMKKARH